MNEFEPIITGILEQVNEWEPKLLALQENLIKNKRNKQNRTIRQIVGHMVDSASNNTHRIVHMQYQESPLKYPNYATNGNNDRWIAIQNYQDKNWTNLVQLWKYSNIHITHVMNNVDMCKLDNQWEYDENKLISLKESIIDYLRHLKLHLNEIDELINE